MAAEHHGDRSQPAVVQLDVPPKIDCTFSHCSCASEGEQTVGHASINIRSNASKFDTVLAHAVLGRFSRRRKRSK
eukprot:521456-Prymnesium_polylepis.1